MQAMRRLVFSRSAVCGWTEPPFAGFEGPARCVADPAAMPPAPRGTMAGRLHRIPTSELRYGPFNADFVWGADNWCALSALGSQATNEIAPTNPCIVS